jgi:NAD(P)-dependent dehydrogenase (short-subunit alcohol dehydrogenase family)
MLDLASFASVSMFVEELEKDDIPVDILLANAGMLNLRYEQTPDGWESTCVSFLDVLYCLLLIFYLQPASQPFVNSALVSSSLAPYAQNRQAP